jgi:hypothetical protein
MDWPLVWLLVANLVPLAGVIFLAWDLRQVLLVFWAETTLLGLLVLLRWLVVYHVWAILPTAFFTIHFGGFCAGHLIFILLLSGGAFSNEPVEIGGSGQLLLQGLEAMPWWALPLVMLPHVVAQIRLAIHEFGSGRTFGEMMKSEAGDGSAPPYGRIVIMHIAIIGGAFISVTLGNPLGVLVLLVMLKIGVDVALWRRNRRITTQNAPAP